MRTSDTSQGSNSEGGATAPPVRLQLTNVSKHFGSLAALSGVGLAVRQGEIRALLGENGAGKTTLMNVTFGLIKPDTGTIEFDGREVQWTSPREALAAGVSMVHQHFSLIPNFTVLENLMLGLEEARGPFLDADGVRRRVGELLEEYGFEIDLNAHLADLPVAMQQRVEIVRSLYRGANLLIFDEPTAALGAADIEPFFATLRRLRDRGATIIFISHKLEEVLNLCDQVTVLRHGRVVGELPVAEATASELARLMVGRELEPVVVSHAPASGKPVLEVRGATYSDRHHRRLLDDVSLEVRPGEILGIAAVAGNGQDELISVITGLAAADNGTVSIDGHQLTPGSRRDFLNHRGVHIPEDRREDGLVLDLSIQDNLVLGAQRNEQFTRNWLFRSDKARAYAEDLIASYSIKGSAGTAVGSLSGGHQQRVILARELSKDPRLIVAVQPIRGLDVSAAQFVHELLGERARGGAACLLVSPDLDELLELSDRLAVMYKGEIAGVLSAKEANWEKIGLLMGGARTEVAA
jgi:ABC-type uncharacterized transport system ATPase subunit